MMRQMRENTKWIMLITAAAFVALMVFEWGMDLSGQTSAGLGGGTIGTVNGEAIGYEEYTRTYRDLYNQQEAMRDAPISPSENEEIEDAAFDQIVTERLIRQELDRRDIGVTEDEIRMAARFAPPPEFQQSPEFQTDGQFDYQKYHTFLASASRDGQLMAQLEAYYRDMIPRNKLFRQIMSGVHVTDGELWRMWRDEHETARVRYIAIDPASAIADDEIEVTDREVEVYYREHRDDFERPARATVRYVTLNKAPLAEDTAAALEHARELRQELLDGADFGELASSESADPGSAQAGGELGTVRRGETVPAFDQAIWELPIGEISEPVLSQFGYHLIRVDSRSGDEATVRHILIPVERTGQSEIELLTRADSLEMLGETMTIEGAAEAMGGLPVGTSDLVQELSFIPSIGQPREGTRWAFEDAGAGDVSPVFESEGAFYMLELVERQPARRLTLEEASNNIRTALVNQKKRERARELGRRIADEVRSGRPMDEVAAEHGLEVAEAGPFSRLDFVPGLGQANAAIGTAFGLEPGSTSDPIEADSRLFILTTLERTEADREAWEEQKEDQRAQMVGLRQQQRLQQFLEGLRENAEIIDNRDEVLRDPDDDEPQPTLPPMF